MDPVGARPLVRDPGAASFVPGYSITAELLRDNGRVIYRGQHNATGRSVLIRMLAPESEDEAARATLRLEEGLLARIDLPGVARSCGIDERGPSIALILEDVGGELLRSRLARGRLDPPTFLAIAVPLTRVTAELHRRSILHGDLHPGTILVDPEHERVSLIDLSFAARPGPRSGPAGPLKGAIAYMAPEQTGRTGREVDHRSDLYALGVTFYEMLTGRRPFDSNDPLAIVHAHLAQKAVPPSELDPAIPGPLSDIVMKLLAKAPEDRYQSGFGLEADLACCCSEWKASGRIEPLVTGRLDVPDRPVVPQQLYGRQAETTALREAFERAGEGRLQFLLVSGYAGIGKTSLIRELQRFVEPGHGHFVSGKFDQIARVPYGGLVQALEALVGQLLTEGDQQLSVWRSRLDTELGTGAAVLAELIPGIQALVGSQPPPPAVGPMEAQNRFRLVMQKFLVALSTAREPLAMFLDDLQWADSASLDLLQPLLTNRGPRLLLIGAYRDNEVDAAHPLARTLGALGAASVPVQRLALGPLELPELALLIRDTLQGRLSDAEPLARLVLQKTGGNPFFVIQFLTALWEAPLFLFDYDRGTWTFDLEAVARANVTDNVVDLMTQKIQRLPHKAQTALMLAACIGNRFERDTLAIVSQQRPEDTVDDLAEAVREGLILQAGADGFIFLHDRVQQAAYALIPAGRKQHVHLTVGRLLLERASHPVDDPRLFEIANHLNLGSGLITGDAERLALARLNLAAARKSKASTAYQAALGYHRAGTSLLGDGDWEIHYELVFALHLGVAECEYLSGDFESADRSFTRLYGRARTRLDRAKVYELEILQYESLSRYDDAIRVGKEALRQFGLDFPSGPEATATALQAELAAIHGLLRDGNIESLLDLPLMADPETRAVMRLLSFMHTPLYLSADQELTLLNTATMVRLSLAHGNTEESAYAYALHAMHVGPILGQFQAGYEFGSLALRLSERFAVPGVRARVLMNLG
ncbi:MAG TPA: serine/threonine-protein kinase PknK, partial [Gemmatimonadales bacterium]